MTKNHIDSIITVLIMVLNAISAVLCFMTGSYLMLAISVAGVLLMAFLLRIQWNRCVQSRSRKILLG